MPTVPTHRAEHTGDHGLDRIQSNVRALVAFVRSLVGRVDALQSTYGLGVVKPRIMDANRELTATEMAGAQIVFVGTLTAGRTVTIPRATDATAYFRWFTNVTAFAVTVANQDGSLAVAAATSEGVWVSSTGPGTVT